MALYKIEATTVFKEIFFIKSDDFLSKEQAKAILEEAGAEPVIQSPTFNVDAVVFSSEEEFDDYLDSADCVSPWMDHKLIINGDGDV